MADLQEVGVEFVAKGLRRFRRAMRTYNEAVDDAADETEELGEAARRADRRLARLRRTAYSTAASLSGMEKRSISFSKRGLARMVLGLSNTRIAMVALLGTTVAVTAAVAAAAAGAFFLAARASQAEDSIQQFGDTSEKSGTKAQILFSRLQGAARNTVSDIELLESTNKALADTTEETAQALGDRLPQVLRIARVQANRTGRDVQKTFNELVKGIKETNPELIANANISVNAFDAQRRYARQIGTTAGALSEQQKQQAFLNATIRRGEERIRAVGDVQLSTAQRLQRTQGILGNIANTIGQLFQGPLNDLLMRINTAGTQILNFIRENGAQIVNTAGTILKTIGDVFGGIIKIGLMFARPILEVFLGPLKLFRKFLTNDGKRSLKEGAIALIEALGNAYLSAANDVVFPVILKIARFIRDALTGSSPAKIGPLKNIDKGAASLMKTWATSIGNVSLEPVREIAKKVDKQLGSIGQLSLNQVEKRLMKLDRALLPFENRVKILNAEFEAFKQPAQNTLDLIQNQISKLQEAVVRGEGAAAKRLRKLREQQDLLREQLDTRQTELQQAKLQLQLKQAQQSRERTLLNVQQRRLKLTKDQTKEEGKQRKERDKAASQTGGEAPDVQRPTTPAIAGPGTAAGQGLEDISFFEGEVTGGESLFRQAEFNRAELTQFQGNRAGLQAIGQDIRGSEFFQNIQAGDIESALDNKILTPVRNKINRVTGFFNNPEQPGSIPNTLNSWSMDAQLAGLRVGTAVETKLVIPVERKISKAVGFFTDPEQPGSIPNTLNSWSMSAQLAGLKIGTAFDLQIVRPIENKIGRAIGFFTDPEQEGSMAAFIMRLKNNPTQVLGNPFTAVQNWVDLHFKSPIENFEGFLSTPDTGFLYTWSSLPQDIIDVVGDFKDFIVSNIFDPFKKWVMGTGEVGGLPAIMSSIVSSFGSLPRDIFNALKSIGRVMWSVLAEPIEGATNAAISGLNSFLTRISEGVNGFARAAGIGDVVTIPEQFVGEFTLGGPPAAIRPSFPGGGENENPPGARRGGLFSSGSVMVGERGRELMTAAQPFAVMSNRFVRAMDAISNSILGQGGAVQALSSVGTIDNSTNNVDRSLTMNMNGRNSDPMTAMQRLAEMRAFNEF